MSAPASQPPAPARRRAGPDEPDSGRRVRSIEELLAEVRAERPRRDPCSEWRLPEITGPDVEVPVIRAEGVRGVESLP